MWWMIIIVLALLIPLAAIFLDSELGRALANRIDRRGPRLDEGTGARLNALEGELERLSEEVQRLGEESDFLHRLLEGRTAGDEDALPSGDET